MLDCQAHSVDGQQLPLLWGATALDKTAWASGLGRVWSTAGCWTTAALHQPPAYSLCLWQACGLAMGEVGVGGSSACQPWNDLSFSFSLSSVYCLSFFFLKPWQRFLIQIPLPARLTHCHNIGYSRMASCHTTEDIYLSTAPESSCLSALYPSVFSFINSNFSSTQPFNLTC